MFSVEEINEMQKTIERKDRIIKVLKERVRQWIKEYNLLDEIIEMYKMSENEANEIIAELKHTLDCKNATIDIIKSISQPVLLPDVPIEVTNKYKQTLQEIKAIAEDIKGTNTALYMNNSIIDATARQSIELQARFISTLITKVEEE